MSLLSRKSISAKLHRVTSKTRHVFDTLNHARKVSDVQNPQTLNHEAKKERLGKVDEDIAMSKSPSIRAHNADSISAKVKPTKNLTQDHAETETKPEGLPSRLGKGALPRAMPNIKKSKTFAGLTVTAKVEVTFPKRSTSTPRCCGNCGAPIPLDGDESFAIVSTPQVDEGFGDLSASAQDLVTLPAKESAKPETKLADTKPNAVPPAIPIINIIESDSIVEEEFIPPISDYSLLNISHALIQNNLLPSAFSERHLPPLDNSDDSTLEDLSVLLPSFALSILDEPAPPSLWEQAIAQDFGFYLAEESKKDRRKNHSFSIPSNFDESDALIDETFGWDLSFSDLSASLPAIPEETSFPVRRRNNIPKRSKRRDEETIIISDAIERAGLPRDRKGQLESVVDWDLPSFDMSDAIRPSAVKFANGLAVNSGKSILSWELPPSRFSKDPWDKTDMLQATPRSRSVRPVTMRRASTASSLGSQTTISTASSRPSSVGTADTCITTPNSVSSKASKPSPTRIPRSRLPIRR